MPSERRAIIASDGTSLLSEDEQSSHRLIISSHLDQGSTHRIRSDIQAMSRLQTVEVKATSKERLSTSNGTAAWERVDGILKMNVPSADDIRETDSAQDAMLEVIAAVAGVQPKHCKLYIAVPESTTAENEADQDDRFEATFQISVPSDKKGHEIVQRCKNHTLTILTIEMDNRLKAHHIPTAGLKVTEFDASVFEAVPEDSAATTACLGMVFALLAAMISQLFDF